MAEIWHTTWSTHNSRVPTRKAVWLDDESENFITKTIVRIIAGDKLKVYAYNICGDHVHLLIEAEYAILPGIIGKIKSMSAREYNIHMGRTIPHPHLRPIPEQGGMPLVLEWDGTGPKTLFGRKNIINGGLTTKMNSSIQ